MAINPGGKGYHSATPQKAGVGMAVYPELARFGGKNVAAYVSANSFASLALTSFRDSLDQSVGQIIQLAIAPYVVRFDFARLDASGGPPQQLELEYQVRNREVSLRATDRIVLTFTFGFLDPAGALIELSTLTTTIFDLHFVLDVGINAVTCSPGDARVIPAVQRRPDFDALLASGQLSDETATRLEGMLLYSGLIGVVTKAVADPHQVDLTRLFPGFAFRGAVRVEVSLDSKYLFLTGTEGMARRESPCGTLEIGDGIGPVQQTDVQLTTPANPQNPPAGSLATIRLGVPAPVAASTLLGRRARGEGRAGLYFPNEVARGIVTEGPFPAVRVDLRDNGFIGWKATGIVDFNDLQFIPEPDNGRFFVDLRFRAEVYGSIQIDLGKLGKIRVTEFSAEQAGAGVNLVRIGCYFVLGSKGVYLKPVVEDVQFAPFEVFLRLGTLVGTPFGGWGAVAGFVFDTILSRLMAWQLPRQLDLELRSYMGRVFITLLDAYYATEIEGMARRAQSPNIVALYDGGAEGFLVSSSATW